MVRADENSFAVLLVKVEVVPEDPVEETMQNMYWLFCY